VRGNKEITIEKEEMLVFVLENAIFKYERYPIRNQEKNYE
jgi:hypothetical protein